MSVANDAYGDCIRAGFSGDQCGRFERCVQQNAEVSWPIQMCQPDGTGGYSCTNGTSDPFHVSPSDDPYYRSEVQCYNDMGAPPFPTTNTDPPPEVPPYDSYDCQCGAHSPSPILIYMANHPVATFALGALTTLGIFALVAR